VRQSLDPFQGPQACRGVGHETLEAPQRLEIVSELFGGFRPLGAELVVEGPGGISGMFEKFLPSSAQALAGTPGNFCRAVRRYSSDPVRG
jgi:hypothetical protein